jgi:uncharacterized membrane protein (UPF0127 family)
MGQRSNRVTSLAAATAALLGLLACSPQAGAEAVAKPEATASAKHPISGLAVIPVTITSGKKIHTFKTEVAATGPDQTKGLMFRTELAPDEAMIFPRDKAEPARFWMKNTPIPLDIIFIGPDRRIANIAAMTVPYSLDGVESQGAVIAVFEIAGGRAAELGIQPGDKVDW